jgi:hypothetical protein
LAVSAVEGLAEADARARAAMVRNTCHSFVPAAPAA